MPMDSLKPTAFINHFVESGIEFGGSGVGLGVGFKFMPFVSVNLEYRSFEYDRKVLTNGIVDFSDSEIFISASVPFDF